MQTIRQKRKITLCSDENQTYLLSNGANIKTVASIL